jgi:hypothetical protein
MARVTARAIENEYPSYGWWGEITIWGDDDGSDPRGPIYIEGPLWATDPQRIKFDDFSGGNSNYFSRFNLPNEPGDYRIEYNGQTTTLNISDKAASSPTANMGFGWNGNIVNVDWEGGFTRKEQEEYDPTPGLPVEPENYTGIVNSDNDLGFDLAPAIKDSTGLTIDDVDKVILRDGTTLSVGRGDKIVDIGEATTSDSGGSQVPSGGGEGGSSIPTGGNSAVYLILGSAAVGGAYWYKKNKSGRRTR